MTRDYCVAWWNLENLFDVEGAPERPAWLADNLRKELAGWTADVLKAKLMQLGRSVAALNGGKGLFEAGETFNRMILKLADRHGSIYPITRTKSARHKQARVSREVRHARTLSGNLTSVLKRGAIAIGHVRAVH